MKKTITVILLVLLLTAAETNAQVREIPVEVVVDQLSHGKIRGMLSRTTEAVYKLYRDDILPANYLAEKGCLVLVSRETEKTQVLSEDAILASLRRMKPFMISASATSFRISMESFEDDKGEQCHYDKGDDSYSTTSVEIKLAELDPGVFSAPITLAGKEGKMSAVIRVRYGIPAPAPIKHKESLPINDATKTVELESLVSLKNKKNLNYVWEYLAEGSSEWKELGKTISESVVFFPIRDVFKTPIKTNRYVRFRMKAASAELFSEYVEYETRFTPEVPQFTGAEAKLTPSCFNSPTGTLAVNDLKGVADRFSYYIISGKAVSDQHYPDIISPASKIKSGTVNNGSPIKIEALADGDYTIVVHNDGMEVGRMFSSHSFSIEKYPDLVIKSSGAREATCIGTPDGQILMDVEGGNPSRFVFLITPAMGKQQQFGRSVIFSELLPGNYSVVVKDACNQLVTIDLDVPAKMTQLKGKLTIGTEPAGDFANGTVHVALEGGTGKYKYVVSKNNIVVSEKETATDSFIIERIGRGNYRVKITDLNATKCPGWDTVFTMGAKTVATDSSNIRTMENPTRDNTKTETKTNTASKESDWSATVTTSSFSRSTIREAVYENSSPGKDIVSFATYIKTAPALKKYHIVIEKSSYEMKVYNALDNSLIVTYPVVFGSGDQSDKMTEGDRKTPEGEFRIIDKRMHDKWARFLVLDYPNEETIAKFNERKAKAEIPRDAKMGGDIGIHGVAQGEQGAIDRLENWTLGCISTKNSYIEELYTYIPVGTKVVIKR